MLAVNEPWASMMTRLPTAAERRERLSRIAAKAIEPKEIRADIRVVPPQKPPVRRLLPEPLTRTQVALAKKQEALDAAAQKLHSLHKQLENTFSDVRKLTLIVAHHYDVTVADVLSARRVVPIVLARQTAMYLCRDFTTLSYPDIGRRLGGRDHTTVLHAFRKFDAIMQLPDGMPYRIVTAAQCKNLRADIAMLRQKITETIPGLRLPEGFCHLVRSAA